MAIVRAYGRNLPELPNLLKDPKYAKQRTVLDSEIKRLQSVGAYSSHKSEGFSHEQVLAILQSDATDMSTSSGLLRRVFVLVSICTGLRASGHYGLKRSDDKSHRGGIKDVTERNWDGRIFSNPKARKYCPVAVIQAYLDLCPTKKKDQPFYLTPKTQYAETESSWYSSKRVGKNQFNQWVTTVCESAEIKGRFTVHSFRRTVATWLYEDGWDTSSIRNVTRHKSEAGVRAYTENTVKHHADMAETLEVFTPPCKDE